jgi:adenosylcobinamide kinase/adenosylcobinamide-phosphate guanylyltransferase
MGKLTLILGSTRSGKSTYAENLAQKIGGDAVLYVATSEIKDEEMRQRVEKHRASRPQNWRTLEAPSRLADCLKQGARAEKVILIDCLTVYVSNALLDTTAPIEDAFDPPSADPFNPEIETKLLTELESLVDHNQTSPADMIVVSNEVGLGLVPAYELGRAYRDMLGRANQYLAAQADEVFFLISGLPMKLK